MRFSSFEPGAFMLGSISTQSFQASRSKAKFFLKKLIIFIFMKMGLFSKPQDFAEILRRVILDFRPRSDPIFFVQEQSLATF